MHALNATMPARALRPSLDDRRLHRRSELSDERIGSSDALRDVADQTIADQRSSPFSGHGRARTGGADAIRRCLQRRLVVL